MLSHETQQACSTAFNPKPDAVATYFWGLMAEGYQIHVLGFLLAMHNFETLVFHLMSSRHPVCLAWHHWCLMQRQQPDLFVVVVLICIITKQNKSQ